MLQVVNNTFATVPTAVTLSTFVQSSVDELDVIRSMNVNEQNIAMC